MLLREARIARKCPTLRRRAGDGCRRGTATSLGRLRLVLAGCIGHGSNLVLCWMENSVTVEMDTAGNVKLSKGKSRAKIDGIVAGIMALDRALRRGLAASVYEGRGVREL